MGGNRESGTDSLPKRRPAFVARRHRIGRGWALATEERAVDHRVREPCMRDANIRGAPWHCRESCRVDLFCRMVKPWSAPSEGARAAMMERRTVDAPDLPRRTPRAAVIVSLSIGISF